MSETIVVFAALVVFVMLGYMLGTASGEKKERAKWLRWIMAGIEEMKFEVGEGKKETIEMMEDLVEKTR